MKKQTILVVDDTIENIDILLELLHEYDVITALNGKSALSVLDEDEVDLVLLDIMMPDMDGFEVCRQIKAKKKFQNLPVIFVSAKTDIADVQKGFAIGGVDYVTKPFNPPELLSRVKTHLTLREYEVHLEQKIEREIQKNKAKEQLIYLQSKQAALGEQLTYIAHQWKQPLASLGSIHLLQRTKLENNLTVTREEQMEFLQSSEKLIDFMSQTLDTFKDFYQPECKTTPMLLTYIVNQVLTLLSPTLKYHNVLLHVNSYETEPVPINENEFLQVIVAIFNNALKIFTLRAIKNPSLDIDIFNRKIVIKDNAGGIEDEMFSEIFLPYKSGTNSNGIGLYIAKEVVEKNGGIINASNCEKGAVFTIEVLEWEN